MNINYNAILTGLVFAGLIIALWVHWSESRRARFSLGIDLVVRLDNIFNSPQFLTLRHEAAAMLLSGGPQKETKTVSLDEVLNFFEMVGILMSRGALNDEIVWNVFFSYMHKYKLCAKDYIDAQREKDRTLWEHFIKAYEHLKEIEKHKCGISDKDLILTDAKKEEFLREEAVR